MKTSEKMFLLLPYVLVLQINYSKCTLNCSGPNFIELHKNMLQHEISSLIKTGLPAKFPCVVHIFLVTSIPLLYAYSENHMEVYAKQIFVLSSSMKWGPGLVRIILAQQKIFYPNSSPAVKSWTCDIISNLP